ncbi:MAG TPA: tripartite tricarboxylate transporter substrate binding protein, partial [Chromatiaceae bacterium]|nr:tripartite tricarboxylate transporter substrate binding protein [Chromatiaceae bacterium]
MKYRPYLKLFAITAMFFLGFFPSLCAAKYPSKPVKVIVPWAAGGGTDILTRTVLTVMDKYFPQPMVVVNKTGGAGTVGMTFGLMAKPDGYTIIVNGFGPTCTQPHLKDLQYTEKDYVVVCQLNKIPRILIANNKTPYNNMKEMMSYAKKNPGKIKVAVAGVGTSGHLGMVQIEQDFGVKFTIIPQGGGAHQKTAVMGGHADIAPTTANEGGPLVYAKQVKALGIMDEVRFAEHPEMPTLAEQGFPNNTYVLWHVYAPAKTPPDRVKMLEEAFRKCLQDKTLQKMAKKLNLGLEFKNGKTATADLNHWRI